MERLDPLRTLLHGSESDEDFVRVAVISARGSAPRDAGAAMAVLRDRIIGTIGGGRLEFEAISQAKRWLDEEHKLYDNYELWRRDVQTYALGANLGQCCGGSVQLLFERYARSERAHVRDLGSQIESVVGRSPDTRLALRHPLNTGAPLSIASLPPGQSYTLEQAGFVAEVGTSLIPLYIYGAGHVGRALVDIVSRLNFDVRWVDTGPQRFPSVIPPNVERVVVQEPERMAAMAPPDAYHVVMTYSHAMDLAICHSVLSTNKFGFLGLIGSHTKSQLFRRRLREAGLAETVIQRLVCPIGLPQIQGKAPAEIAVAVAAQLLAICDGAGQAQKAVVDP
ncbi:MAG: xanthine dehydrogenase accessory protein XdhC [Pseudomonadota bacterium]